MINGGAMVLRNGITLGLENPIILDIISPLSP